MSKRYTKDFRLQVAKEASKPELQGLEHIVAEKYGVKPWTVRKWSSLYLEKGESGLTKGSLTGRKSPRERQLEKENAELREEVAILKKAAAFLADLRRE
jgi:transposase